MKYTCAIDPQNGPRMISEPPRKGRQHRGLGCRAAPVMLVICNLMVSAGCLRGTSTGAKTIAIIPPAGGNEFNSDLASGAAEQAKKLGWNPIKHLSPTGDADD